MSASDTERILCFPRQLLSEHLDHAEVFCDETLLDRILANIRVTNRQAAEHDYSLKQLVVYTLVTSGDRYLVYWRTHRSSEERLRQLYSIGIGGHVNVMDESRLGVDGRELLVGAVWRELKEEISIRSKVLHGPELTAFINDDTNDVGRVHFGTVWTLEIAEPAAELRGESGLGRIAFHDLAGLEVMKPDFEQWSQLLIESLAARRRSEW